MHMEIAQATDFLGRLLHSKLDQAMLQSLKDELAELLKQRFVNHWDPQQPYRGNGFRAISNFNGQLDPVLVKAAINASIPPTFIHTHLPRDFVLWIDPGSVSYRVGDHGNIMTLFEDRSRGRITFKMDSQTISKSNALAYIQQPRISTPVRISPPNSPESIKPSSQSPSQSSQQQKQQPLVMAN
ncbi:hypothetical protein BDA99DRAFT_547509 [Phascolomyces articulosus]|uniref:Anti-proliferative protein domain-containing protein n=1 Tax=Phascolomyces articulosus TaxID=60185 RepID=A0AAD5JY72_9FUNG|nr:hypothetical protein BDA99DRAFT_547509 [Phascolomyces articulosus]